MCPACMTSMALVAAGSTSASALAVLALTQTQRDACWVCAACQPQVPLTATTLRKNLRER